MLKEFLKNLAALALAATLYVLMGAITFFAFIYMAELGGGVVGVITAVVFVLAFLALAMTLGDTEESLSLPKKDR